MYIQYDDYEIIQKIHFDAWFDDLNDIISCEFVELSVGEYVEFYNSSHMGNGSTYLWCGGTGELYEFGGTIDSHTEGYISNKIVKKYNLPILNEKDSGYGYSFVYHGGKLTSKYYDVNGDGAEDAVFEGIKELVSEEENEPLKRFLVKDVYLYTDFDFVHSKELSYEKEIK